MRDLSLMLYHFACPSCAHILKAPACRAGAPGVCPACRESILLPVPRLGAESWTARQVSSMLAPGDRSVEPATLDRAALFLAQGTCVEYTMAREPLPATLSARQWRHLLLLAASRELIRLDIVRKVHDPALADVPAAFDDHPEAAAAHAWSIMARYLHFNRHGICSHCHADRTGLSCIYQSLDRFLQASHWDEPRIDKWRTALSQVLGIRAASWKVESL